MKVFGKTTVALGMAALSSIAQATLIVDQNQPSAPEYMASFNQQDLAQSFRQTQGNIAGAGIFMQAGQGLSDTVTIALWDALPNQAGAHMLTSASGTATSGSWFDLYWAPETLNSGVTYFLVFTSMNGTLGISGSTNNPYAFGDVYANSGYNKFTGFDYTFRTYYDDQQQNQVPEPAPLGLLGLGLAGIAFSMRRLKA